MEHPILTFIGGSAFLLLGLACLFWTEKVRGYYLKNYIRGLSSMKWIDASWLVKRFPSVLMFRLFGLLCVFASLLIFYEWLKS
jgi:hypothetical protein